VTAAALADNGRTQTADGCGASLPGTSCFSRTRSLCFLVDSDAASATAIHPSLGQVSFALGPPRRTSTLAVAASEASAAADTVCAV